MPIHQKHRRRITLILTLLGIEALAVLAYLLTARLGNFEYDWYPRFFLHNIISFETAKFLFLSGAQLLITLYAFVKWHRKSYSAQTQEIALAELLKKEENERLEFKSSLRFDYQIERPSRNLERSAMKTIAAFLNSQGGSLVMGVSDKRLPIGLQKDYQTLQRKDRDGFENHFTQVFNAMVGPEFRSLVQLTFEDVNGAELCHISIKPSPRPVYFKYDQNEHFFMRTGNITTSLKMSEVESYVRTRWPKRAAKFTPLLSLLAAIFLLTACSTDTDFIMEAETPPPTVQVQETPVTEKISAATLHLDFNQTEYDAATASGQLVVLYFYANWCPICIKEFPEMQRAFQTLPADGVIGFRVNYNDSQTDDAEKALARKFGVAYQHTKVFVKNGERILKAPDNWTKARYEAEIAKYL